MSEQNLHEDRPLGGFNSDMSTEPERPAVPPDHFMNRPGTLEKALRGDLTDEDRRPLSAEEIQANMEDTGTSALSIQGETERRGIPRDRELFTFDKDVELHHSIFNTTREYGVGNGSLFLQETPGLLDSINKSQPRIWELYKKLKKLDWDENEFNYGECRIELETGKKEDIEMMVATLAWQWEADSIAANHIVPIMAPFVTSSELWAAYVQIGQNEIVHGLTYSEIVNNSFADGQAAMKEILSRTEAFRRLGTVGKMFADAKRIGAQLTLGLIDRNSDEARDACMLMVYAMLGLERVQFMPSFAITFAFGETGRFMPIAKAVQKICNEEFSIHVEVARAVIRNEMKTAVGRASFERIKHIVAKMYAEIIENELRWTREYLFQNGQRSLTGCTMEMVCDYVLYGAHDVYTETGIANPFKVVNRLPIGYMADWIDIDKNQASPQEEKTGNYLLGGFVETAGDKLYSIEGL